MRAPPDTPILTYHSIGHRTPPGFAPWVVHPQRFAAQLGTLADAGLNTLTVRDLVHRRQADRPPDNAVVLTFDDGFADFLEHAVPVLQSLRMTATLFIISGAVGGEFRGLPTLDWPALQAIRDAGFEIGAHSHSHPALDRLAPEQAMAEIKGCKQHIEDKLGIEVHSFAYPFGYYNRQTRQAVVSAGYSSACALHYAFSPPDDDPFALRRTLIRQRDLRVDRLSMTAPLYRIRSFAWAAARQSLTRWVGYAA
jgi:peptidoglycan/xylan/chitin deacetylase (PgdA/CDA1 family)